MKPVPFLKLKLYTNMLLASSDDYKKTKREFWLYYIDSIKLKTLSSVVWGKIQKLSSKFVPFPFPVLKMNDTIIEPTEVAEKLGKNFFEISSHSNYSPGSRKLEMSKLP